MNIRISNCCLAIVLMVLSSVASASLDVVSVHGAKPVQSPAKTLTSKPDIKCDAPDITLNNSATLKRSCLIPLSSIDKLSTQKDFSFVDVRSPADYDRYHIAGSINIPLHQVKSKDFLKKLSVVMVNDGRSTSELEKTCAELKLAGFSRMSVLDGGLFAWNANKRKLEGDPVAQAKLNRISAEELIEERDKKNLYVIDVSTTGKHQNLSNWLPGKIIASPFKLKGDAIKKITALITQHSKKYPQDKILLIADDNDVYERIDVSLQKSGLVAGILRLEGGINGYREYIKKQMAIWSEQNKPRRYEACRG